MFDFGVYCDFILISWDGILEKDGGYYFTCLGRKELGGITGLKLLLDIHVILWSAAEPERFPPSTPGPCR